MGKFRGKASPKECRKDSRRGAKRNTGSKNAVSGYGGIIDSEEEEDDDHNHPENGNGDDNGEEKARLVYFIRSFSENSSCLPKNSSQGFTSIVRTFLATHLKELSDASRQELSDASRLRSYCATIKKKCSASLTRSALCFSFEFPVQEKEGADSRRRKALDGLVSELKSVLRFYRRFSLMELCMATSGWSESKMLGEGLSGSVYKGELGSSGKVVAVKVLKGEPSDRRRSFTQEVSILCNVRNDHILPLLGYCVEDDKLCLVYPYMPRGSLDDLLYGPYEHSELSWKDRHRIAVAVIKALHYLHTNCNPPVIHRDIKPSNILLTEANQAKLADFGLALEAPLQEVMGVDIMGTIGYCAPECFEGRISTKSDIFSLGILLVELISGKRPSDECSQQRGLAVWAWQHAINSVKCQEKVTGQGPQKFSSFIDRMVDPKLGVCSSLRELQCLICIGLLCIHPLESYRPSINEVLNLICKNQASILYRMVIEKYHEAWYPAFSIMDRCRFTRTRDDDQMKKHIEIAMADMEEHSSLLHNHNRSL